MRQSSVEPRPDGRSSRDVISVVQTPVGPREHLLRNVRVGDDRIDRDIRQIARLVRPGERSAVRVAYHPIDMARCRRRILAESAHCGISNRGAGRCRVEGHIEDGSVRKDRVAARYVHPDSAGRAGAHQKTDLHIPVVRAHHRRRLIGWSKGELVDKRAVAQRLFG